MERPNISQERHASVAKNFYQRHIRIIATILGSFVLVLLLAWCFTPKHHRHHSHIHSIHNLELPAQTEQESAANPNASLEWVEVVVQPGDSLSKIFKANNFSQDQLHSILAMPKGHAALSHLHPDYHIKFLIDKHNNILQLVYTPNSTSELKITHTKNHFSESLKKLPTETRLTYRHGVIKASLFNAGLRANIPSKLIMQLVEIFQWDIDFAKDIRPGDNFSIIYEQQYVNGEPVDYGDIIAAEFINHGATYQAVRYTNSDGQIGYYNKDGRSMKRRFIRTPVKFARISSYFKPLRWHPVLHRFRKHAGVDYAAPAGTPIKATGYGKIDFIGRKGGYGNAIIIDHGNGYTTLYGHMLRFAKNLHRGTPIKQGQIIGYVGMTGLATGPHCHYEFRINNEHRDPLRVTLPQGSSIASNQRKQFFSHVNHLMKQMALYDQIDMAAREDQEDQEYSNETTT